MNKRKKKFREGTMSHLDSINELSSQLKKYILKHGENPNSVINDVAIAVFAAFSEVFSEDEDTSTNGIAILQRVVEKIKHLMKNYDDLVPEEGSKSEIEDEDIQDMESDLGSNDDLDLESLEDEPDNEDRELDEDLELTVDPDYDGDVDQQKDIDDGYVA